MPLAGLVVLALLLAGGTGWAAGTAPAEATAAPAPKAAAPEVPAPNLPPPPYLAELLAHARAQHLAQARFWLLLLHMMPNRLGPGVTSEVDGPGFFLAPGGKTDPRAELDATLAAFFSGRVLQPGGQTAQCTFPARYRWLAERLRVDPARLPPQPCPRWEAFRAAIDPGSVTLIFASFYLNNPASAFGHTLLRFDLRGRGEQEHLLDYTLNFAAAVPPEDGGMVFAWKGIFGGYRGYFSVLPYYLKVLEYGDIDSRDLWEYRLTFSADQADWMLRHTWELGSTYFDYYFFRDNCSYYLLSLLEIADPALHLRERFPLWTLPSDTVRLIAEQPGLVQGVTYRASRSSLLEQKLSLLTGAEQQAVLLLIQDAQAEPPGWAGWPAQRQALVLDTAADYFQLKLGANPEGDARLRAHLRALLLRRSTVRATYPAQDFPPRSSPPEQGQRSASLTLAVGAHSGGSTASAGSPRATAGAGSGGAAGADPGYSGALDTGFVELGIQPAFHDLLSPERGYAANSQITLGQARVRYEPREGRLGVERLDLVDVVSLSPLDAVLQPFSWELRAGWQRSHDGSCPGCVPFLLRGGAGLTGQVDWPRRTVAFLLLDGAAEADPSLATGQRSGVGPHLGLLTDVTPGWRLELSAARTFFTNGQPGQTTEASVRQRIAVGRNGELRLNWSSVQGLQGMPYQEAALEAWWHF